VREEIRARVETVDWSSGKIGDSNVPRFKSWSRLVPHVTLLTA
jgi:hypothetical protein